MTSNKTDVLLSAEADKLIWEFRRTLTYREVVQAVARARVEVRDAYRELEIDLPPVDEYVALVIGMARQRITARLVPTSSVPPIIGSQSA